MKLLLVAATEMEIEPIRVFLEQAFAKQNSAWYHVPGEGASFSSYAPGRVSGRVAIDVLITGVGMTATALHLGSLLSARRALHDVAYDWVVHVGIAGAFPHANLEIGRVVEVEVEYFGDLGIEEGDGRFVSAFEMGLIFAGGSYGQRGFLENPHASRFFSADLPLASGITVNKVHGSEASIRVLLDAHFARLPDIESMEGAAFFLTCLEFGQPFCALRAISNLVEKRARDKWDVAGAIAALGQVFNSHLCRFDSTIG